MHLLKRLSVLIVEDDPVDLRIIKRMLESLDVYRIVSVSTLEAAIDVAHEEHFGCVLLDWNLPDGDGRAFLNSAPATMPVILLTGATQNVSPLDAFTLGSLDYINKNEITPPLLEKALRHSVIRQDRVNLNQNLVNVERFALVGRIAAGVAHEINNPLAWLVANIDFLGPIFGQGDPLPQRLTLDASQVVDARELLEECQQAMSRIKNTSKTLLEFAELKHDKTEPLELNTLVSRVLDEDARFLEDTKLRLTPRELWFEGSEALVAQSLTHILANAKQAIERAKPDAQHEIRISTHEDDGHVYVSVEDTGDGVAPSMRAHAFQPFVSHDPSRSGMGLAFVARTATIHNGTVQFLDVGSGAHIQMSFPKPEQTWEQDLTQERDDTREEARKCRVLVIDSKPHITKLLLLAAKVDCEFVRTESLKRSLEILEQDTCFDGVFVNVSLLEFEREGMDWYQRLALRMPGVAQRVVVCSVGVPPNCMDDFLLVSKALLFKGPFDFNGLDPIIWHWKKYLN